MANRSAEVLSVGQLVPVRVIQALHEPMQSQASVVADLLVCDRSAPVYRLEGALDAAARAEFRPLLAAIDAELAARAALLETRRSDLWLFELLLYAYKSSSPPADREISAGGDAPAWRGPGALRGLEAGAEERNVLEIARQVAGGAAVQVAGYWSRSLSFYRSSPLAAWAASPPAEWEPAVAGHPRAVFGTFLKSILDSLVATREMVGCYSSAEVYKAHQSVWKTMRGAQKQA